MVDKLTPERRAQNMRAIGQKNTKPEMIVRRILHRMGYRYRLHGYDLPGRPDIVFSRRKKIIQVFGCYWHGHECKVGKLPKSKLEYWGPKIQGNKARDQRNRLSLEQLGWSVLEIWECDTRGSHDLNKTLRSFLGPVKSGKSAIRSI